MRKKNFKKIHYEVLDKGYNVGRAEIRKQMS